jgi:transcriptional regulator with XRE-family HTH domain
VSTQTDLVGVPEWDLADRLRKSLREADDLKVEQLADELGYTRQTVSAWLSGRAVPRRSVILAWAVRTGVNPGWLETGETPEGRPDGGPSEVAPGQDIPLRRCEDEYPGLALVA